MMSYNVRRYDIEMLLRMSECFMKQKIFIHLLKVTFILLAKKKHLMHINLTKFFANSDYIRVEIYTLEIPPDFSSELNLFLSVINYFSPKYSMTVLGFENERRCRSTSNLAICNLG